MSAHTRLRVEAAMHQLDYRPNLSARSLRSGRTGMLTLAIPDLTAPYFAELAHLIIAAAREHGYTVLIEETAGDKERESTAVRGAPSRLVDGTIISPLALDAEDLRPSDGEVPIVLLGERLSAVGADHVSWDNQAVAFDAAMHLARLGRTRIAVVGCQNDPSAATSRLRYQGYRRAMAELGMPEPVAGPVIVEGYAREDGIAAVNELMQREELPDALLCFNDELAIGAMRRLHELGRGVPGDIAVVGIDDIRESAFVTPTLTTVAPDKLQLARTAVRCVIDRLNGLDDPTPRDIVISHRVIVRESTRPLR